VIDPAKLANLGAQRMLSMAAKSYATNLSWKEPPSDLKNCLEVERKVSASGPLAAGYVMEDPVLLSIGKHCASMNASDRVRWHIAKKSSSN